VRAHGGEGDDPAVLQPADEDGVLAHANLAQLRVQTFVGGEVGAA
jgi:hypothetical protein